MTVKETKKSMTTRVKKWNGNLLPTNFFFSIVKEEENFSYLFLAKIRMKVFLALVTNLTSFSFPFSFSSHPFHRSDRKGFRFSLSRMVLKLILFISCLQDLMSFYINIPTSKEKRKGWTVFNIFYPLSL